VTAKRLALGRDGERRARREYRQRGYNVVAQNWRVREGEIDLIVTMPDVLVFCEVKTRSSDRFGTGLEAVDWRKQRQVRAIARRYLAQNGDAAPRSIRFDVAVVTAGVVTIVEDAF
jgi:putative endonuclease